MALEASVIKPSIQMGKGEMLLTAVFNIIVGLFARLVEHHEASIQPLNRFVSIANAIRDVFEANPEIIMNLGNVLGFTPGIPGQRAVHMTKSEVSPETLAVRIYADW